MLQEIIEGVAGALHETFGDGYKIYQNDVRQGLEEPCFLIGVLEPQLSPLLGITDRRYQETNPLDVHYFPREPRDHAEMVRVAEELFYALEVIKLRGGGLVRGTDRHYEIADDVLHFFVRYNPTIYRSEERVKMETLDLITGTNEER